MKYITLMMALVLWPSLSFAQSTVTSALEVEKFVDQHDVAIVALSSDWCEPCREMEADFDESKPSLPTIIYKINDPKSLSVPRVSLPIHSVPTIVVFKGGIPIDIQFTYTSTRGPTEKAVFLDLVSRALSNQRTLEMRTFQKKLSGKVFVGLIKRSVGAFVIPGADFSGLSISRANFGGSDLRDTKWHTTTLRGVVFSGSDLTGASFEGADLRGVFWGKCICPNGISSEKFGYSCLEAMR